MEGNFEKLLDTKERQRERDKNGVMHAVSTGKTETGCMLSFFYGSGKVTHFVPNRVIPHLLVELERWKGGDAHVAAE